MSTRDSQNGGEESMGDPPPRPRPRPQYPPLNVTEREALQHYGTIATGYHAWFEKDWPAAKKDIDESKAASMAACGMAKGARDEVRGLREDLNKVLALIPGSGAQLPPPPPAPRMPSAYDIAEEIRDDLKDFLEEITSPGTEAPREKRTDSERVRIEFERLKGVEAREQLRKQEEAAEKEAQEKRNARRNAVYGVIATVAGTAILALCGLLYAALQREAVLAHRLESSPTAIPVPVPTPTATAATLAPATAGSTMPEPPANTKRPR